MNYQCVRESELLELITAGRWTAASPRELIDHVSGCASCSDLAAVTVALLDDRRAAEPLAGIRPSGAVWWRMQVRRGEEDAVRASRLVRRLHAAIVLVIIAAAATALAVTSLASTMWAWVSNAAPSLVPALPASSPTLMLLALVPLVAMAPVAVYLAFGEE